MTDRYEPPRAPLRNERDRRSEARGRFDVIQCVSEAWADTWASFPVWLGVWLVGGALALGGALVLVGIPLLWPALFYGTTLFYLNMTDHRARFVDLFAGFQNYVWVLVSGLILGVLMTLIGMIGNSLQTLARLTESTGLMVAGTLVSLAWTLLVVVRFYFAPMLWVERGLSPVEALQESWELTRGQVFGLVLLVVANVVLVALGLLVLLVGVIPAINMSYLIWTSAYRQTVGSPERDAAPIGSAPVPAAR